MSSAFRHRILGCVTALVLLPIPAYAAIDFTNFAWTLSDPNHYLTATGFSFTHTSTDSLLTFTPVSSLSGGFTTTVTYTGPSFTIASGDAMTGTWKNLNDISITGSGTPLTITIGTSGGPPFNNMFSHSYGPPGPPSGNISLDNNLGPGTYNSNSIVITIKGTAALYTSVSSFTLDFGSTGP
jgi:hypothetical protein